MVADVPQSWKRFCRQGRVVQRGCWQRVRVDDLDATRRRPHRPISFNHHGMSNRLVITNLFLRRIQNGCSSLHRMFSVDDKHRMQHLSDSFVRTWRARHEEPPCRLSPTSWRKWIGHRCALEKVDNDVHVGLLLWRIYQHHLCVIVFQSCRPLANLRQTVRQEKRAVHGRGFDMVREDMIYIMKNLTKTFVKIQCTTTA